MKKLMIALGGVIVLLFLFVAYVSSTITPEDKARYAAQRAERAAKEAAKPPPERNVLTGDSVVTKETLYCTTEALYEQLQRAINKYDDPAVDYLTHNGCGALPPGLKATVLDRNILGPSHVRIYMPGIAAPSEIWVDAELGLRHAE